MSWGERSCKKIPCALARIDSCNVNCGEYQWDGYTKPDSKPTKETRMFFEQTPFGTRLNRQQRRAMKKSH